MRTIREALTAAGDIYPGDGELLIRIDPLTAPRRTQALAVIEIPHYIRRPPTAKPTALKRRT